MTTSINIEVGNTYYFGHRRTPNTVTRVIPLTGNSDYVARVYLKGPRGGESAAYIRKDGTCRKI